MGDEKLKVAAWILFGCWLMAMVMMWLMATDDNAVYVGLSGGGALVLLGFAGVLIALAARTEKGRGRSLWLIWAVTAVVVSIMQIASAVSVATLNFG